MIRPAMGTDPTRERMMGRRKPFLMFVEGDGGDGEGGGEGNPPAVNEHGYPDNTPWRDMAPEQQVAYWQHQSRKHEQRANARSDYEQQKADAEKWRQAQLQNLPADQRALEEAREQARQEARAEVQRTYAEKLVAAEMRVAFAGRRNEQEIADLLSPLDMARFLTDEGEVNTDMVRRYADSVAPASNGGGNSGWPDTGQGKRGEQNKPEKSVARGRELYEASRKK